MNETTSEDPNYRGIKTQVKVLKIAVVILLVSVAGMVGWFVYQRHLGSPVTIYVNETRVATVRNFSAGNSIVEQAERTMVPPDYPFKSIIRIQRVKFTPASAGSAVDPDTYAIQSLKNLLKLRVRAWVIQVSGRNIVGLPTNDAAAKVITLVGAHYAALVHSQMIGAPKFKQRTVIVFKSVDASDAYSTPEQASPLFWQESAKKNVVVKRGDTGSRIARRNHITLAQFIAANSGINVNRLSPGDLVNVQKSTSPVDVEIQTESTRIERILQRGPESDAGKRQVKYIVTSVNGVEIGRRIESSKILSPVRPTMAL